MLTNQSVQTTWEDNTLKITIQSERRNRKHRRSTTPSKVRSTKVAMQQYYSTFSKSLNLFHLKYHRSDATEGESHQHVIGVPTVITSTETPSSIINPIIGAISSEFLFILIN